MAPFAAASQLFCSGNLRKIQTKNTITSVQLVRKQGTRFNVQFRSVPSTTVHHKTSKVERNLVSKHNELDEILQNEMLSSFCLTSVANIPGRSTLRASSSGNLVVPRTRRRIGDRAFSVAAPQTWNRLPRELKLLRSTDSFRRDPKTFLFDSVYRHQDTD